MQRSTLDALMALSEIHFTQAYELANRYWPDCEDYAAVRRDNPWWLVLTSVGPMVIGHRKRVISISWADTAVRGVVTEDDVTKDDTMVHAWTRAKAVEYLTALNTLIRTQKAREDAEST